MKISILVFLLTVFIFKNVSSELRGDGEGSCRWKGETGASFDLGPLTVVDQSHKSYYIEDGDIPCTPKVEPSFSYSWNICSGVTSASFPAICKNATDGKRGIVLQYYDRTEASRERLCHVASIYGQEDIQYALIAHGDPSKGVSLKYPAGEFCQPLSPKRRSVTVDVVCDNVRAAVESAQETAECVHHIVMRSYYGCPQDCPITSQGLCDSHGHCAYDESLGSAHCFCNHGFSGKACELSHRAPPGRHGSSLSVALLSVLLIVSLVLLGGIGLVAYRIAEHRRSVQASGGGSVQTGDYAALASDPFKSLISSTRNAWGQWRQGATRYSYVSDTRGGRFGGAGDGAPLAGGVGEAEIETQTVYF